MASDSIVLALGDENLELRMSDTHPEDDPSPSWLDRWDWKRIVKRARFDQESPFFVIVGRVELTLGR